MYRLMIKTHETTGLRYLCVTKRENWKEYTGSGIYWKNHLQKYGKLFSTELIYESDDFEDFCSVSFNISNYLDVVLSEEFANLIHEDGGIGSNNFKLFWDYASDMVKREIYNRRVKSREWYSHSEETKTKISERIIEHWNNFTIDERRAATEKMRASSKEYYANKETEAYLNTINILRKNAKNFWCNMSEEYLNEYGKKISIGRHNMSKEAKALRGVRVAESFKESKKRQKFITDMKTNRLGTGNPASKPVKWMGEIMPMMQFKKLCKKNRYTEEFITQSFLRDDCEYLFDQTPKKYPTILCPHCKKISNENKKPSTFKRWHFDNCKGNNI